MNTRRQSGLSLIELLISLVIGLLLLVGLYELFVNNSRSFRQNESIQGIQDQARFALSQISRDISMAGYWGGMLVGGDLAQSPTLAGLASDCGPGGAPWAFVTSRRVEFFNGGENGDAATAFGCIADVLPGTDAVAVRRAAGQRAALVTDCATAASLTGGTFYIKTNGVGGSLLQVPGAAHLACVSDVPIEAPFEFYRYVPRVYFIRDHAEKAGDGIPTLCRAELAAGTGTFETECLAEGVENLQITWGFDSDGDLRADRYSNTPTAAEMNRAVSAQVYLLVRSLNGEQSYEDKKVYSFADVVKYEAKNADDEAVHHYRKLFSTTVQIRNPLAF